MATIQKLSYTAKEIDEKLGMVDSLVKTVNGVSPDENGDVAIGGDGFTSTEKSLMMDLLKNVAYTSDMSATISRLEKLWSGSGDVPVEPDEPDEPEVSTYTVTNNLTGATNSNSATTVNKDESYSAALTIIEGYTWESVVITMGGVDITDTAYGDGYITIYEVSGDIVITAIAILPAPVYELASVLECDGTQEPVDTGVILMDEQDEAFTIMIDYEVPETGCNGYVFGCPADGVLEDQKYLYLDTGRWYGNVSHNALYFSTGLLYMREPAPVNKVKLVLTHTPGETQINTYYMLNENGEKQTALVTHGGINVFGKATMSPLLLAALEFKGTINRFKIYDRVVAEDEINEFLGGVINGFI